MSCLFRRLGCEAHGCYNWLMRSGEEQVWDTLSGLDPAEVCIRTKVAYDASYGTYLLRSFLADIMVSPEERTLRSHSPMGSFLLGELGNHSRLSMLWYLIGAKDIPLLEELVNPSTLSGGEMFLRGTHVLPLDRIAKKYGPDTPAFLKVGRQLGGEEEGYADASVKLFPFPRVPVFILLWQGDSEFPAYSTILFDYTCEAHLPVDILWATAMMSIKLMLRFC